MNAEIISVGAEVISGDVSNTNASYLSQQFSELGITVTRHTAVDDRINSITEALAAAVARSNVIVFTGGLGPTADDMTKEVVCAAVGLTLTENAQSMARLQQYFAQKNVAMPEQNKKQALFPSCAIVFPNPIGTADGCAIESGNQCIIMLPGPPSELEAMFEGSVKDYLRDKTDQTITCRTLKVFGLGESQITEKIAPVLNTNGVTVATYVGNGDIRIKITAAGEDRQHCQQRCDRVAEEICTLLGNKVYARENISLQQTVVTLLKDAKEKLATAESCTAGMLSEMLTEVDGASSVFEFGLSAYANRVKQDVLGVPGKMLKQHGAVSYQVAEAMAKGAAQKGEAKFGIGITGIAGPTGGTKEKPVGLVYVSLYDGTRCFTRELKCNPMHTREKIRLTAVMNALDMIRLYLIGDRDFLATPVFQPKKKEKIPFWKTIIPLKGDKPGEVVRKIIMMICIIVFFCSAAYIVDYYVQSYLHKQQDQSIRTLYYDETATINERFDKLLKINPDTVGWLTIPGTQCDNPVVKEVEPGEYLYKSFEGEKSKYGTLFADATNRFEQPSSPDKVTEGLSDNTLIYGHHMRDGAMFGELKNYRNINFMKENPVIQFTTLYDTQTVDWKIVSVFISNTNSSLGPVFEYRQTEFETEHAFYTMMNEFQQRSIYNTGVDVEYGDKLLTLTTCIYDFDGARLIVVARRVRDGESSTVDVSQITKNTDAVYPQIYIDKTGVSGRTEVTAYVAPESSTANTVTSIPSQDPSSSAESSTPSTTYPSVNTGGYGSSYNSGGSSQDTGSSSSTTTNQPPTPTNTQ